MAGLSNYDCEGTLTIGGISMNRPAWCIQANENGNNGLFQFLTLAEIRGQNRILPGATGVLPFRRRVTETRYALRLLVTGDVDETGAVNADPIAGLVDNLDYLWTNVIDPPSTGNSLLAASWTPPGSAARTADIQVERCEPSGYNFDDTGSLWVGLMTIIVPEGRFS